MDIMVLDCFKETFDAETALMRSMDDPHINEYFCKEDKCNEDFPHEPVSMRLNLLKRGQRKTLLFWAYLCLFWGSERGPLGH